MQQQQQQFHETLRQYRMESGLSFDLLAERARTSTGYLYRLEHAKASRPGRNVTIRIGIALGLDIDHIDELLRAAGHLPLCADRPA